MLNRFSFTIKARFNIFLSIIILGFIIIVIFFAYSINRVRSYKDYSKELDQVVIDYLNLRRFEQQFLLRYKDDVDFFKTGNNKYLRKHNKAYERLNATITTLHDNEISAKLSIQENIVRAREDSRNYKRYFDELAKKIFEKGNLEYGIIGEMQQTIMQAQNGTKNPYLEKYILKLRQHEKNYLLLNNVKFYNQFFKTLNELNEYMVEYTTADFSEFNDIDSVETVNSNLLFTESLKMYGNLFSELVKLDKYIGLTANEGLNNDIRIEIHKLDPELDLVNKIINNATEKTIQNTVQSMYLFIGTVLIILVILILQFSVSITHPINRLRAYLQPLSKGILPESFLKFQNDDEISQMTIDINNLIDGLKKTTDFAATIGKGVFDTKFKPLSDKDELGNSLLEMRKNLNHAKVEEKKYRYNEDLRKWANEGINNFGDILRQSNDIQELSFRIIQELVLYLSANQGGIFIYDDTDKNNIYLNLVASYAFNRKKNLKKKILVGEGLIGVCAVEKETIHMTKIPEDYINITSGLGKTNPKNLLIVPLKVEDEVLGIIELASLNKFEPHHIEFVERVSSNIASTLSVARTNTRTSTLLAQSQEQTEEMARQEAEMRQNMEEMQLLQEEAGKKEMEMSNLLRAINSSSLVAEYDLDGYLIEANEQIIKLLGAQKEELIGKHHADFVRTDTDSKDYKDFWNKLRDGKIQRREFEYLINSKTFWFSGIYTPILNIEGEPYKILNIASDISKLKQQESMLSEQAEEMEVQETLMKNNLLELQEITEKLEQEVKVLKKENSALKS